MLKNPFFSNKGPFTLKKIFNECQIIFKTIDKKIVIEDVKDLKNSTNNDLTFFHSIKYKDLAINTKAKVCVTNNKLKKYLPDSCEKIIVDNILFTLAKITMLFYPNSITDNLNLNLKFSDKAIPQKDKVICGKNVLIGVNVKIGINTLVGHNTILEDNVIVGDNCSIGSNVILRNCLIENNVHILDGCIIGKKGFGFIPDKVKNFRYPHIGYVHIKNNCEIGAGCTFDRGSLSNTIIGKNTFFDNQVHLAHNVEIGNNCIIAGQVGIAGSSIIGDNVMIGGQAGISGHLKIGNNVQIGGGSGVIKDIPDNCKVMGYPATEIRNFIKELRN